LVIFDLPQWLPAFGAIHCIGGARNAAHYPRIARGEFGPAAPIGIIGMPP